MGVILSTIAVGSVTYGVYAIVQHEKRPLKVGSVAATAEHVAHPSWEAVVDNYVYIHNAFRNDLQRIIAACESKAYSQKDLEDWRDILDLHSRVEDELLIVALQARLKENGSSKALPDEIVTGKDHHAVKEGIQKALECQQDDDRLTILKALAVELDEHLTKEEEHIVPLLLDNFSTRELWALDSFIVNPKLDYCDKDTLIKITKWWFANLSIKEGWPLLKNFVKAGRQPPMPLQHWKRFQDDIPALQKFPTEDLVS